MTVGTLQAQEEVARPSHQIPCRNTLHLKLTINRLILQVQSWNVKALRHSLLNFLIATLVGSTMLQTIIELMFEVIFCIMFLGVSVVYAHSHLCI